MSLRSLRKIKHLIHVHLQQAQGHEAGNLLHLRAVRVNRQPLRLEAALTRNIQRVGAGQRDNAAAGNQHLQRIEEGLLTGGIEHHIHGLTQYGTEILGAVINRLGTQRAHKLVVRRGGGRKNLSASLRRQLNGEVTDASGTGVNEYALAFLQPRHFEERLVCGQCRQGSATQLRAGNIGGHLHQLMRRGENILGVRTGGGGKRNKTKYAVAHLETRVVAGGSNHRAGNIPAGNEGLVRRICQLSGGTQTLAGGQINRVDTGGNRLDEHVTAHRRGDRYVCFVQNAFVAPFGELNLAHGGHRVTSAVVA